MIDKRSAINSLVTKDVEFTIKDDAITYWSDPTVSQPTEAEIDAEIKRLETEYDTQEYARKRAEAYPSLSDQMDMIMKDNRDGTKTHQTACEAVKKKYPKG